MADAFSLGRLKTVDEEVSGALGFQPTPEQPAEPQPVSRDAKPSTIDEEIAAVLGTRPTVREVLTEAQKFDPDKFARAKSISNETGAPREAVQENLEDFEKVRATEDAVSGLTGFPVTTQWLTANPENAKVSSDSLEGLKNTEKVLAPLGSKDWLVERFGDVAKGTMYVSDLASSIRAGFVQNLGSGLSGLAQSAEIFDRMTERARGALADVTGEGFADFLLGRWYDPIITFDTMKKPGEALKEIAKTLDVDPSQRDFSSDVASGVGQVASQITVALLTGGLSGPVSLATMFGSGVDQVAEDVERMGKEGTLEGDVASLAGGVVTTATEKVGLDLLLNKIPATVRSRIGRAIAGGLSESTQEITEQVINNLVAIGTYNPDKKVFDESLIREGEVGGTVGLLFGAMLPGRRAVQLRNGMAQAQQDIRDTPLAQRDPQAAAEHFASVMEDKGLSVHIPSSVMDQIAPPSDPDVQKLVYEALGVTQAQVDEARNRGGAIRVANDKYIRETILDPTRYDPFINDIRFGDNEISANEAMEAQNLYAETQAAIDVTTDPIGIMALEALAPQTPPTSPEVVNALAAAERQTGLNALFRTAQEAGMTQPQYTEFLALKARAAEVARTRMTKKMMTQQERELGKEWQALREGLRQEVTDEVLEDRTYAAFQAVTLAPVSRESVLDALGGDESMLDLLPKRITQVLRQGKSVTRQVNIFTNDKNAMPVDWLADEYGFSTHELLMSWINNPTIYDRIEQRMQDKAREKYDDLYNQREALNAAIAALHTDQQADVLAAELKALRGEQSQALTASQLREMAASKIGVLQVQDIHPNKFLAEEVRKGQQAGRLLRVGARVPGTQTFTGSDRVAAAQAKFEQIMNFEYARMATKLRARIAKNVETLRALANPTKKHPTIDADYMEQIRNLLAPYDFSERKTAVFGEPIPYSTMTLNAFNNLVEDALTLVQRGKNERKLFLHGKEVEHELAVDEMVDQANTLDTLGRQERRQVGLERKFDRVASAAAGVQAYISRVEKMLRILDNGKLTGVFHKYIYEPFSRASTDEMDMYRRVMTPVLDDLQKFSKEARRRMATRQYVPELQRWMTGSELLMMALNTGNQSNLDKMMDGSSAINEGGFPWSEANINRAMMRLGEEEARWVQKVWDAFEEVRPQVEEVYKRQINGVFKRIEPKTTYIGGLKLRGGYFPMIYQRDYIFGDHKDTQTLNLMENSFYIGSVFSGMTEARSEGYSAPIELDITELAGGIRRAVHFVTHLEPVSNVRKLLNDKRLAGSISDKLGPEYYRSLHGWLEAVATDNSDRGTPKEVNAVVNVLRRNLTTAILWGSYTTMVSQTLGLTTSISVLGREEGGKFSSKEGVKWMLIGMDKYLSAPFDLAEQVKAMSGEMRHRLTQYDRDILRELQKYAGERGAYSRLRESGLIAIGRMQFYSVDMPTWLGAYSKAVARGDTEAHAIEYADTVLRTSQGSGQTKDLTALQRKQGVTRLLTMFSTYTTVAYDIASETISDMKRVRNVPGSVARLAWAFGLAGVLDAFMRNEGPPDDEEPEAKAAWWSLRVARYTLQAIPVAGQAISSAIQGFSPSFSPAETLINAVEKLGELAFKKAKELYEDGETSELTAKELKKIAQGVGLGFGLPGTTQIVRAIDAMDAGEDATLYDFLVGHKTEKERSR